MHQNPQYKLSWRKVVLDIGCLPSLAALAAKAQRKLVLEAVQKRRQQQEQERRKRQQRAYTTSEDYREYQEMLKETAE